MADPNVPPTSPAAAAPEVDATNDRSLILLQRVATAWFILSVAVSAFALYSIVRKLTRLRPLYKWTAVVMVLFGTASSAVQLIYQLMPEGDSSFSWLPVDIVDDILSAICLTLFFVIARWRVLVTAPRPTSWVTRALSSKWFLAVSSLFMTAGFFVSIATYYTGTALCHSESITILCMRLYFMVTQAIIMAGDVAVAAVYLVTWPRYAKITRLDSRRPGFRSLMVVFGLFVSFALQLALMLDGFLSSEIWEGSRILWLAHTTVLVALVPILLLQMQIASVKSRLRDCGTLSSTGSSIEDIKAVTRDDPELGLGAGPRPSFTFTDPSTLTALLLNGSAITIPDNTGSRPRLPSGSNAPPLMRSVTPTSMASRQPGTLRGINPSLAHSVGIDSGHATSLPDPPVSPTTTTSSSTRGRRSKSWIAGMLTLGSGALSTASTAPPLPNGADPALVAPMSPIPEGEYGAAGPGGAESVRSRSIDISSFDDSDHDDDYEHGSAGGSTLMLNTASARATTPPPTSASAMLSAVPGRD